MNDQPDTSFLARLLGQNWKTTLGGAMAAGGGILASSTTGKWQVAGQVIGAIGVAWLGVSARDHNVSSAQMTASAPIPMAKPPAALLALLALLLACGGCRSITVNVPPGFSGNLTINANMSAQSTIDPSLGLGDSAIKAAADAYATSSGIGAAGTVIGGATKAVGAVEAAKAIGAGAGK